MGEVEGRFCAISFPKSLRENAGLLLRGGGNAKVVFYRYVIKKAFFFFPFSLLKFVKAFVDVVIVVHCMNYGQRQVQLSVAIAASLRQLAPTLGGQGLDKLSRPSGRLGDSMERSRCVLEDRGVEIKSVSFKAERRGKASPCETGPT